MQDDRQAIREPSAGPPCARLVIVCGLPGSGKTTHAKEVESKLRAVRFCPDEWMDVLQINLWDSSARQRIEQLQWQLAQDHLRAGRNVVIEWGTWARTERDLLREGARALGAVVELRFLDVSFEELFDRIRRRNMESPPIERDDIRRWESVFQRPSPDEIALFDPPNEEP